MISPLPSQRTRILQAALWEALCAVVENRESVDGEPFERAPAERHSLEQAP